MHAYWLALSALIPACVTIAAESSIPQAMPASRYAGMVEQSPFALATPVEAPTTPKESFALNWVLTSLAKVRYDDGREVPYITIRSQDRRIAFSLTGDQVSHDPDAEGVSIDTVNWAQADHKSSVVLKKNGETAKVEFGQEVAPPAPPPGAPPGQINVRAPGQPQLPGMPPVGVVVPNNGIPNQNANRIPSPIRPNMPQSGVIVPNQPGVVPQMLPPTGSDRRRVRVINSKP